jgi:hypothetical protein
VKNNKFNFGVQKNIGWFAMQKKILLILLLCLMLGAFIGCAGQTVEKRQEPVQQLSRAEQKEQAYEIFEQILNLSNTPGVEKDVPRIKELYREIIDKYPDIGLAQESYLRLILLAKDENTAAGDKEAEGLYQEFLQKYPNSRVRPIMEKELGG